MPKLHVDGLRQPWESDEHWELRKEFIEYYQNDFDEDRLLCLAQVYTNIELLSCSYPDAVMRQVRELQVPLAGSANLRHSRQKRANVQFVKPGERNSSQNKKTKRCHPQDVGEPYRSPADASCSTLRNQEKVSHPYLKPGLYKGSFSIASENTNSSPKTSCVRYVNENSNNKNCPLSEPSGTTASSNMSIHSQSTLVNHETSLMQKLNDLRTLGDVAQRYMSKCGSATEALHNAGQKLGFAVVFDIELDSKSSQNVPLYKCKLKISGVLVADATNGSKKKCRSDVAQNAVQLLRNPCLHIALSDSGEPFAELKVERPQKKPVTHSNVPHEILTSSVEPKPIALSRSLANSFLILDYTSVQAYGGAITILSDSASFCHVPLEYEFESWVQSVPHRHRCKIFLGSCQISEATTNSKQESKEAAAEAGLNSLKKIVYTVKVKEHSDNICITRNQVFSATGPGNALSESNIGCKMLKMMGWSGGSIGKDSNPGILEPVGTNNFHKFGHGLGYATSQNEERKFSMMVESLLEEYARSSTGSDLIFSAEFSKDERKEIHRIATKYNLKNSSKGSGEGRHVVISRKYSPQELLVHLLDAGGSTDKYDLIPPTNF